MEWRRDGDHRATPAHGDWTAGAVVAVGDACPPNGVTSARRLPVGSIELTLTGVTGALHTRDSDRAIGFELCGESEGICRYAVGHVEGDRVVLRAAAGPSPACAMPGRMTRRSTCSEGRRCGLDRL